MKKTKIVCTIGPASDSPEMLEKLVAAGMNVARLNFSHGDHEEQGLRFKNLREIREKTGQNLGILLDTKGPEIRTHMMKDDLVHLEKGHDVIVSMEEVLGTADKFSVTYENLIEDVAVGGHILLDDGLIDLVVKEINKDKGEILTEVVNSGILKSRKGVNVPNVSLQLPGITEKDDRDIRFGLTQGIDFIAASFVRRASDVLEIRNVLEEEDQTHVQIFSKIENQEGVDNIDEIIEVSDGIMIARGDLGVEIPTYEVPILQKSIIKKCNLAGKPVITATQMLDSMQHNPRPTRAEANDVANAIYDGTDAVMLSGETAAGEYPLEAVKTMAAICNRTEEDLVDQDWVSLKEFDKHDLTESIGQAVGHTARNLGIETIVAATSSGHTARMIAKYRPKANIIAATFSEKTMRKLSITWGVQAYVIDVPQSTDDMLDSATELVVEENFADEGDLVIITAGVPVGESGTTNLMKVQLIAEEITKAVGVGRSTAIGRVVLADSADQAQAKMTPGAILVAKSTDKTYMPAIEQAGAIIIENGGMTSHAAIVGVELGIPVIVGADGIFDLLEENQLVTVDARSGRVFKGASVNI